MVVVAHQQSREQVDRARDDGDVRHLGERSQRLDDRTLGVTLHCGDCQVDGHRIARLGPADVDAVGADHSRTFQPSDALAHSGRRHPEVTGQTAL